MGSLLYVCPMHLLLLLLLLFLRIGINGCHGNAQSSPNGQMLAPPSAQHHSDTDSPMFNFQSTDADSTRSGDDVDYLRLGMDNALPIQGVRALLRQMVLNGAVSRIERLFRIMATARGVDPTDIDIMLSEQPEENAYTSAAGTAFRQYGGSHHHQQQLQDTNTDGGEEAAMSAEGTGGEEEGNVFTEMKREGAPLRKRELNAIERAVIRQEILRRLGENSAPSEIPLGLRFRRVVTDPATPASSDDLLSAGSTRVQDAKARRYLMHLMKPTLVDSQQ